MTIIASPTSTKKKFFRADMSDRATTNQGGFKAWFDEGVLVVGAKKYFPLDLTPGSNITAALQAAINDYEFVEIVKPGTYEFSVAGATPYTPSGPSYCFLIDHDDFHLRLGPGVILKLADNEQTDATGYVYGFIWRSRSRLTFTGGKIDMNSQNQPGYSGGYGQQFGGHINGYGHVGGTNNDIQVIDMDLVSTFGNPFNCGKLDANGEPLSRNIWLHNVRCHTFGEGPQIIGGVRCGFVNCRLDDPNELVNGDGFELSNCRDFVVADNVINSAGSGTATQGSWCDCFGSKNGSITGNVVNGWQNGLGFQTGPNQSICENISVTGNTFKNIAAGGSPSSGGTITFSGNIWKDCGSSTLFYGDSAERHLISITRAGTVATVVHADNAGSHGYQVGEKVLIAAATQAEYNGIQTVTTRTLTSYTFTVAGSPATPATGTPTARRPYTLTKFIGDTFEDCGVFDIRGNQKTIFADCDFIAGSNMAILIYANAYLDLPETEILNCRFKRNFGACVMVGSDAGPFAPPILIRNSDVSGNGDTVIGFNDGLITGLVQTNNIGFAAEAVVTDVSIFDPSDLAETVLWLRSNALKYSDSAGTNIEFENVNVPIARWKQGKVATPHALQATGAHAPILTSDGFRLVDILTHFDLSSTITLAGDFSIYISGHVAAIGSYFVPLGSSASASGINISYGTSSWVQGETGALFVTPVVTLGRCLFRIRRVANEIFFAGTNQVEVSIGTNAANHVFDRILNNNPNTDPTSNTSNRLLSVLVCDGLLTAGEDADILEWFLDNENLEL